jgi:hypothetical protein
MPFPLVWLIPPIVGAIATKAAEKVLNPPPPPPPPPPSQKTALYNASARFNKP